MTLWWREAINYTLQRERGAGRGLQAQRRTVPDLYEQEPLCAHGQDINSSSKRPSEGGRSVTSAKPRLHLKVRQIQLLQTAEWSAANQITVWEYPERARQWSSTLRRMKGCLGKLQANSIHPFSAAYTVQVTGQPPPPEEGGPDAAGPPPGRTCLTF